jgi:hypothetical protein
MDSVAGPPRSGDVADAASAPVEIDQPLGRTSRVETRQTTGLFSHERLGSRVWSQFSTAASSSVLTAAELLAIVGWAVLITRPYLNMDPWTIPSGGEYLDQIRGHYVWRLARDCGWCALWNGSLAGGYPGFVELLSSQMHPLVALTTLGWGVVNGSKLALVGAFAIAGLAQWWLGRAVGLGRIARLWSALLAVAGGHLAARMELGMFSVVLATAACAMVLPPLLIVARTASRRAAIQLGVALALVVLAGSGYVQIGFAFTLAAAVLLFPLEPGRWPLLARRFALAGALAVLLSAYFLVPLLQFLPQLAKATDPTFGSAQPFALVPLNLVIGDHDVYRRGALAGLPYPWLYENFIGWVPVLLAFWGLGGGRSGQDRRAITFLAAAAVLELWVASAVPLAWLDQHVSLPLLGNVFGSVRYPSYLAGLAVAPILGLAAIGLDRLLRLDPTKLQVSLGVEGRTPLSIPLDPRWLLVIPLAMSLQAAQAFSSTWIGTIRLDRETISNVLAHLQTRDRQWVATPFGEHIWSVPGADVGLKQSIPFGWTWKGRTPPEPVRVAQPGPVPPELVQQAVVGAIPIYAAPPGREYAAVTHPDGARTVCQAQGQGGMLDVTCDTAAQGVLRVVENSWSGWRATLDGQSVPLRDGPWLSLDLPAGSHTIAFRYQPWDVPIGILLFLVGVVVAVHQWRSGPDPAEG